MRRVPADRRPIIVGDVARLPLTRGQVAVIDAADVDLVTGVCWHAQYVPYMDCYYAVRNGSRLPDSREPRTVLLHRLLADAEPDRQVDHANHDTLDNRRSNLRVATRTENQRNRLTVSGTSGYMGVYRMRGGRVRPWGVKVSVSRTSYHVGYFATAFDAALGRDAWIREHCPSEFWTFNFPLLPGERGIHDAQGATA